MLTRRTLLRIGGLSVLAGLPAALRSPVFAATPSDRRCIFIMLQGGPSHIDLWDPKPSASQDVRGPFEAIGTSMAGVQFGELMPSTSRLAHHLCIIRSMTHEFTNHIAGTYITLTGSHNQPDQDREAHADDFPGPGAVLNYLQNTPTKIPPSISLPSWLSIPGPSNRMPGQYAGFLGSVHDPFLIAGDPHHDGFKPLALELPDGMNESRLGGRLGLLGQLDRAAKYVERELDDRDEFLRQSAYDLVVDGRVRAALDLQNEPEGVRDRYGKTRIGQSLLLARRLIEAGVRFVAYNAFNQEWDTHGDLKRRYQQIVPPVDQGYSALIADLHTRGLLDNTLVICGGEFGRTPVVNNNRGRDHWPNVYTMLLAGGGLKRGLVLGESDAKGATVRQHPVHPEDILATMWQQMGIAPRTVIYDRLQRPHALSSGRVLEEACG
jgi:hypothetical protein